MRRQAGQQAFRLVLAEHFLQALSRTRFDGYQTGGR